LANEHSQLINDAFKNQLESLKNPPLKREQLLDILINNGMRKTIEQIITD